MKYNDYHENKQRGSFDFPCEFYHLDPEHPRYTMPYHWHTEYEIIRIMKGEFSMILNGMQLAAKEGDLILLPGGMLHGGYPKMCVYECIVFDMQTLIMQNHLCKRYLDNFVIDNFVIFCVSDEKNMYLTQSADVLFDCMQREPEGYKLIALGILCQIFGTLLERGLYTKNVETAVDTPHIRQFKTVLSFIEERYSGSITLDELSRTAGMTPKYFCRFFRQMSRRSPIEYLNYYRIEKACEMLADEDKTIADVAFSCGFNDISYFIKTFKKHKDTTPGKYRADCCKT